MTDEETRQRVGSYMVGMLDRVSQEAIDSLEIAVSRLVAHARVLHEHGWSEREIAGALGSTAGQAFVVWMEEQ